MFIQINVYMYIQTNIKQKNVLDETAKILHFIKSSPVNRYLFNMHMMKRELSTRHLCYKRMLAVLRESRDTAELHVLLADFSIKFVFSIKFFYLKE